MDPKLGMYLGYLAITIGLTVWVARTLFRNGRVFLNDALATPELADAVNRMLVVGFYLINFGYVALVMRTGDTVTGPTDAVERLATKIGVIMLVLGVMHLLNMLVLNKFRKRFQAQNLAALVPPHLPPGRPQQAAPLPAQYQQHPGAPRPQNPQQPAQMPPVEPVPVHEQRLTPPA